MLAEGITLPEQVALPGAASAIRRTRSICSAPVRLKPVGARAVCTAATQPSAELAAGLSWTAVGTRQATATVNEHVLVYHRTPILWTRACRPQPARGVWVADQRRDPPLRVPKAGASLGLLLRCGCGQQLG